MNNIQKGELIFVRLLLPLIIGISVGLMLPASMVVYQYALFFSALILLLVGFLILTYQRYKIYLRRWKPGLLVHFLVFVAGMALTMMQDPRLSARYFAKFKNDALVVSVNSEPKLSNNILRFEAKVEQGLVGNVFHPRTGLLLISVKDVKNGYHYGDQLLISGAYTPIEPAYNPFEFNYQEFLAHHGIYYQVFVEALQVQVLSTRHSNVLVEKALALRKSMVKKYADYISDKEAASVASTLILGYKAELSREVLSAYSKTGTMHVLSVSGMHVGLVFYILNALLWFMNRTKRLRVSRALIVISLIWFYALITGFSPSVSRAALMLSFFVLGKAVNRSSNSYNLVAISAVFLLIYNPYFLLDIGFQLSYLAVLGLIYFYPKIYNLIYIRNWIGDKIWSYIALSTAAQLATFPLALYYFHQFPVYFLLSNLFIVLPVTAIMYLGIAFLFVPWDSALKPMGWLLERAILLMDEGLFFMEKLPLATFSSYHPFAFYLLICIIILGSSLSFQFKNKPILYGSFALLLLLITYQSFTQVSAHKKRTITFYSLRKHTAFSLFSGDEAYVFSDLDSANKALAFSVHSSVDAGSSHARYFGLQNNFVDKEVLSANGFICFGNWKMMIWNKELNSVTFSDTINVDALLLTGRPKVKVQDLVKSVKFKILMIDGTNPDYLIDRWISEARHLAVNYYVLKKNPAYSITLN